MKTHIKAATFAPKTPQNQITTTLQRHSISHDSSKNSTTKTSESSSSLSSHKLSMIALSSQKTIINNSNVRNRIIPKIIHPKQSHQAIRISKKPSIAVEKSKKYKKYYKRGKSALEYADLQAFKAHIKLASEQASNNVEGRGISGSKKFGHEVDIKIPVKNRYTEILKLSEPNGSYLNKNIIHINQLKFHGKGFSNLIFDLSKRQQIKSKVQNIKGIEMLGIGIGATMQIIVLGRERKAFVRIILKREKSFLDKIPRLNKVLAPIEKFLGTSDVYFFPPGW